MVVEVVGMLEETRSKNFRNLSVLKSRDLKGKIMHKRNI